MAIELIPLGHLTSSSVATVNILAVEPFRFEFDQLGLVVTEQPFIAALLQAAKLASQVAVLGWVADMKADSMELGFDFIIAFNQRHLMPISNSIDQWH